MGLTAWTGFSRFASPALASITGYDALLFEQNTNDANDQFLRKLSIYAKGKMGKLDYRFILSDPLLASKAASGVVKTISVNSDFSFMPPHPQTSAYATAMHLGYGKNYIRNLGVMNPGDGVATGTNTINGAGNAFPMMGTGNIIAEQVGLLLPKNTLGEKNGQLQTYIMVMHDNFDRLPQAMLQYDAGLNWYMNDYRSKLTLNYQNRPIFSSTDLKESNRKSMVVLQFQIAI